MPVVTDLGIYLGIPSLHGRVSKVQFQHVLDKIRSKLSGWKAKCLSFAARIVLTRYVLNTIPYYTMQTVKLPLAFYVEVDKICRCFLWGHDVGERQVHLINWDTIVKPIGCRGLGIRPQQLMNKAALAKLAWQFLIELDSLWVLILKAKYGKSRDGVVDFPKVHRAFNLW
ncbi:hypothetical protein PTKIN_Ptkin13bG0020000 [Pterospermum kingtungense]